MKKLVLTLLCGVLSLGAYAQLLEEQPITVKESWKQNLDYGGCCEIDVNNNGLKEIVLGGYARDASTGAYSCTITDPDTNEEVTIDRYTSWLLTYNSTTKSYDKTQLCDTGFLGERPYIIPCDFNNDGYVDIYVSDTGRSADQDTDRAKGYNMYGVYLNDNGSGKFVRDSRFKVLDEDGNEIAWQPSNIDIADFNCDGLPDIVSTGYRYDYSNANLMSGVLINNGDGTFTATNRGAIGEDNNSYAFFLGDVKAYDLNNDGYPDIVASGEVANSGAITSYNARTCILLNKGNTGYASFTPLNIFDDKDLYQYRYVHLEVADFYNNGVADISFTGQAPYYTTSTYYPTLIKGSLSASGEEPSYSIDTSFALHGIDIEPLNSSNNVLRSIDYNGDGYYDLLIAGWVGSTGAFGVASNQLGYLCVGSEEGPKTAYRVPGASEHCIGMADYGEEGALNYFLTGYQGDDTFFSNNKAHQASFTTNPWETAAKPDAPTAPKVTENADGTITLSWTPATTSMKNVSYEFYLKKDGELYNGCTSFIGGENDGMRKVLRCGNAWMNTSITLRLPKGSYEWGVQTINAAYRGSTFANGDAFEVTQEAAASVKLTSATMVGTVTETGEDVDMTEIKTSSSNTGIFESYQELKAGEFIITGVDSEGNEVTLGDNGSGTIVEDGNPITVSEGGVMRVRVDTNTGEYSITPVELYLKGNIVVEGTTIEYVGNGVFSQEVVLDDSDVAQFSNKYFYFAFNNDDNLAVKRLSNDRTGVGMASEGASVSNIRINGGTYTLTLDMTNYKWDIYAPIDEYKISTFGSSSSNGYGASNYHGYAYMYNEQLAERYAAGESEYPFTVSGISIDGNSAQDLLDRYDEAIHDFSRYVIIGLGLTNEGFYDTTNKQPIVEAFYERLEKLVEQLKDDGRVPIIMCGYPRNDATTSDYEWQKEMNVELSQWDVPMINCLDPVNDTQGHWAANYYSDSIHPSSAGHQQLMYAIPTSMFDALTEGKEACERDFSQSTTLEGGATIHIEQETSFQPYTMMVRFKGNGAGEVFKVTMNNDKEFTVGVIDGGYIQCVDVSGNEYTSTQAIPDDDDWHYLTLSTYYCQGVEYVYLDKTCVLTVSRRNTPASFTIGDEDVTTSREFSELFFWRSPLNEVAVEHVVDGNMFKASLEIYSPLSGAVEEDGTIANLAQSLNAAIYVENGATGINAPSADVSSDNAGEEEYYSISGVKQSGLQRGVNIVKTSKGAVKQVVK